MDHGDGANRRRFSRVNYPCLVTIRKNEDGKDVFLTHTRNLSAGGATVICFQEFTEGMIFDIEIDLLEAHEHVFCRVRVVWSTLREYADPLCPWAYELGIEFQDISREAAALISTIVRRGEADAGHAEPRGNDD